MNLPRILKALFRPRNAFIGILPSMAPLKSPLLDLPLELVLMILEESRFPDILSFSLSCKLCYMFALPILKRSIVITQQSELTHRASAKDGNSDSGLVQQIQLGRMDKPGLAERWNVSHVLIPTLIWFQNLHTLTMCGATFVKGWDGLDEVGRELGKTLRNLQVRLEPPFGRDETTTPCSFTYLESVDLFITGMKMPSDYSEMILLESSIRFPALRRLKVSFHVSAHDVSGWSIPPQFPSNFFSGPSSHFPQLRSFDLALPCRVSLQLNSLDSRGLLNFLGSHSGTLRELTLPPFLAPILFDGDIFPSMQLSRFQSGADVINVSIPSDGAGKDHIHELALDLRRSQGERHPFRTVGPEVRENAARWPYQNVRRLSLLAPGPTIDYSAIPLFFPLLEDLTLQFLSEGEYQYPQIANHAHWECQQDYFVSLAPHLQRLTVQVIYEIKKYRIQKVGGEGVLVLEESRRERETWNYWTS